MALTFTGIGVTNWYHAKNVADADKQAAADTQLLQRVCRMSLAQDKGSVQASSEMRAAFQRHRSQLPPGFAVEVEAALTNRLKSLSDFDAHVCTDIVKAAN